MFEENKQLLLQCRNYAEFSQNNGFILLRKTIDLIDHTDKKQIQKLDYLLKHFINIFISEKLFTAALDIYNVQISYFWESYDHARLISALEAAIKLAEKISLEMHKRKAKQEPDHKNFNASFLDFYNQSQKFISKRIQSINSHDKLNVSEEYESLHEEIETQSRYTTQYLDILYKCLETQFYATKTQSLTDELTKLHNRRYLIQHYSRYYLLANRLKMRISVITLDLDKFKRVNDTYGHHMGDEVLKRVADVIQNSFRQSDIKVRIGGDEFVILLFDDDIAHSTQLAKDVLDKIKALEFISDSGKIFHIGASVGISCNRTTEKEDAKSFKLRFEAMIKEADIAMYYSKNNTRGITVYTEELKES